MQTVFDFVKNITGNFCFTSLSTEARKKTASLLHCHGRRSGARVFLPEIIQSNRIQTLAVTLVTDMCISTDRKSTRLNSSHVSISYAATCLKKKTCHQAITT